MIQKRYNRTDGIHPHQDLSATYDGINTITSLPYGRGSILTIQDSNKPGKQRTALYYQFPGDAIIMSGKFNLTFYHGVPAVDSWASVIQETEHCEDAAAKRDERGHQSNAR